MVAAVQSDVSTEVNRKWPVITNVPQWTHFPIFSFLYVDASSQQRWVFFCVSQILVQSPGTVVDPGFPESKFRPVVLVRKSSFLHIVQLSLTVTVKSVWISLHKHQLSGTEEKKNPCRSLWKSFTKAESFVWAKTSPRGQGSKCTVPAKKRPARGRQQQSF